MLDYFELWWWLISVFLCFCQLRFSPDSNPSWGWIVGSVGHRDAANLTEDSGVEAWRHEAQVTYEGLTIIRVIELHKTTLSFSYILRLYNMVNTQKGYSSGVFFFFKVCSV